jgi:alkylation response protein AidB-like acyl-CoA dehydrogenase
MTGWADDHDIDAFRKRAATWLAENVPVRSSARSGRGAPAGVLDRERVARARAQQRALFDAGLAGLCYPVEYGGRGLTAQHQRVFTEEAAAYESPLWLNMSTLAIIGPTLLEFGTEEQKGRHIPAMLQGDEFWAQLLSEPTGGSDLAGAVTTAQRDGDEWVLNGSKIWTSGGHLRDFGLCLARTDWDTEKHLGLTMFIVELSAPGVEIRPIRQIDGSAEFCQEFFDDVVLPADAVVGAPGEGWTVARRLIIHERAAVGGTSPYAGGRARSRRRSGSGTAGSSLVDLAVRTGQSGDLRVRQLLGEAHALRLVREHLGRRITAGLATGLFQPTALPLVKLMTSTVDCRIADITLQVAGSEATVWDPHSTVGPRVSSQYLARQVSSLGGGTSEIQRNMISEGLLGMPREPAPDRGVPFRDVRRGATPRTHAPGAL